MIAWFHNLSRSHSLHCLVQSQALFALSLCRAYRILCDVDLFTFVSTFRPFDKNDSSPFSWTFRFGRTLDFSPKFFVWFAFARIWSDRIAEMKKSTNIDVQNRWNPTSESMSRLKIKSEMNTEHYITQSIYFFFENDWFINHDRLCIVSNLRHVLATHSPQELEFRFPFGWWVFATSSGSSKKQLMNVCICNTRMAIHHFFFIEQSKWAFRSITFENIFLKRNPWKQIDKKKSSDILLREIN